MMNASRKWRYLTALPNKYNVQFNLVELILYNDSI